MVKILILFFLLFSFFTFNLHAQTAEQIERLLATSAVTYADAAAFVLEAAGVAAAPTPAEAFGYAAQRGWLPKRAAAGGSARLDGLSLLIMRSFNLRGGLFYSVTKNAHYAYREMVYLNGITGIHDPAMAVSGDLLLFMVSRVLSWQEADW